MKRPEKARNGAEKPRKESEAFCCLASQLGKFPSEIFAARTEIIGFSYVDIN